MNVDMFYELSAFEAVRYAIYGLSGLMWLLWSCSVHKEPRHFLNVVLLAASACLTWISFILILGYRFAIDVAGIAMFPTLAMAFLAGIALLYNGIVLFRKEGFSLSNSLPVACAALIFVSLWVSLYFILEATTTMVTQGRFWAMPAAMLVLRIFAYFPLMFFTVCVYSFVYKKVKKSANYRWILVLGCWVSAEGVTPLLRGRLDKAIEIYRAAHEPTRFLVSGGKGSDEQPSEAEAMRRYLVENGVPDACIVKEDQSTTTAENMIFSRQILEKIDPEYSGVFVTSNYHVLRSAILAKSLGVRMQGIGGETAGYYQPSAIIREVCALIWSYRLVFTVYILLNVAYTLCDIFII